MIRGCPGNAFLWRIVFVCLLLLHLVHPTDGQCPTGDTCRRVLTNGVLVRGGGPCSVPICPNPNRFSSSCKTTIDAYDLVYYNGGSKPLCNGIVYANVQAGQRTDAYIAAQYLGCCNSGLLYNVPSWAQSDETALLAWIFNQNIHDKRAIAVIMGNLQWESGGDPNGVVKFRPISCEGRVVVDVNQCPTNVGVGLLQWTGVRHQAFNAFMKGKSFAYRNSMAGQLAFLETEWQWQSNAKACFAGNDKPIGIPWNTIGLVPGASPAGSYFECAKAWIGWGLAGSRGQYAGIYLNKL